MAGIAWWVWLSIGLFISISSAYVGGKLKIFAWIGILFVIIGIAKIIYLFVFRERETAAAKPVPIQQTQHFYCPRCRFAVHAYDFFCRKCGARLR